MTMPSCDCKGHKLSLGVICLVEWVLLAAQLIIMALIYLVMSCVAGGRHVNNCFFIMTALGAILALGGALALHQLAAAKTPDCKFMLKFYFIWKILDMVVLCAVWPIWTLGYSNGTCDVTQLVLLCLLTMLEQALGLHNLVYVWRVRCSYHRQRIADNRFQNDEPQISGRADPPPNYDHLVFEEGSLPPTNTTNANSDADPPSYEQAQARRLQMESNRLNETDVDASLVASSQVRSTVRCAHPPPASTLQRPAGTDT